MASQYLKRCGRKSVLVIVLLLLLTASCDEDQGSGSDTGAVGVTEATGVTSTGPTGTTSSPPPQIKVPGVEGGQLAQIRGRLKSRGLVISVETKYSSARAGTVLRQIPSEGRRVYEGSTVVLVVAEPLPVVPNVLSKNSDQAKRALRNAGYDVEVRKQESTTQPDNDVVAQNPSGGAELRPGRTVTITVINNVCTPGYSPCIPQGSDVDCQGGSGNGPRYVSGPVRVTGSDPYDLDSDNDGVGCES